MDLEAVLKGFVPAVLLTLVVGFIVWVRNIYAQKQANTLNQVDLTGQKIRFDLDSKPASDIVAESNKSHDANDASVVPPKREDN